MAHTLELRKAVNSLLQSEDYPTYFRVAPASAEPPYLVWMVEELSHDSDVYLLDLTVDLCAYGSNDEQIERWADALAKLDFTYYLDDSIEFRLYHETRNTVEESDKNIMRRRLTYSIRLVERT